MSEQSLPERDRAGLERRGACFRCDLRGQFSVLQRPEVRQRDWLDLPARAKTEEPRPIQPVGDQP